MLNNSWAKKIFSLFLLSSLFLIFSQVTLANGWRDKALEGGLGEVGTTAYGQTGEPQDFRVTLINIFRVILGLLGVILFALIVYAGFSWMTAAGNEDKIKKAKQTLSACVIGLVIILAAWGVTIFVTTSVFQAMNNQ